MKTQSITPLENIRERNSERKRRLSGVPATDIEAHEDIDILTSALEAVLSVLEERDKWSRISLAVAEKSEDPVRGSVLATEANHALQQSRQIVEAMEDVLGRSRRSVEINVPSGRLIVADDLRSVPLFDIDTPYDRRGHMDLDALAEMQARDTNAAYVFVSNSCPSVVRKERGVLEVVTPDWGNEDEPALALGETVVAEICTDLWATMMTDYQHWLDNGGPQIDISSDDGRFTLIDVPPGRYRWTMFAHVPGFEFHGEGRSTYARLELIEPL
ncbi:hypothetical protein [Arthrobacter koreensis]|uniref:hypothetical protein n=1 Tax=Arthrobacter koreensis TaxID=199136 RepID=UPI00380FCFA6